MLPFKNLSMYNIAFTEEHEVFMRAVEAFVEKELEPRVREIEERNTIPPELYRRAAELGFFGLGVPESLGGQGMDNIDMVIFNEAVSRVCPAFTVATLVHGLFVIPLLLFGTEEQKTRYIPPLARGEKHAAHATTEPGAGSDVAGIQTRAVRRDGGWVINGRKYFISAADKADYFVVLARTSDPPDRRQRWRGLTMFIVERGAEGFRVGEKIAVMGIRGSHPSEVILDDVWVPEDAVVGRVGEGFKIAMATYDHGRLGVAAQGVGLAQGAFEKSLSYAVQRTAFERPIISYQAIQFYLADIFTEIQAARLLTYWAASLANRGVEEAYIAASAAKLYATEVAEKAALRCISIHGGIGVAVEGFVERFLRDSQVMKTYEGTSEIQRLTIIRQLLKKVYGLELA